MGHLHAYIDESGDRGLGANASDHFILSAVMIEAARAGDATQLLADLRRDLGRRPTDVLHFQNLKAPALRLHAARELGAAAITHSSVIVSKRHLAPGTLDGDAAYLYTFRLLLERLSWFARDNGHTLEYTLAHIRGFPMRKLRTYEFALRNSDTQIHWASITRPGAINSPGAVEELQLADIVASAFGQAFPMYPNRAGVVTDRYVRELAPRLYRRGNGANSTYGVKMHPWNAATQAAFPWVNDL